MTGFVRAIAFGDLPDGVPRSVILPDERRVCLVRVGQRVFAVDDRCSHADFPMGDGDLVDDFVIECALHGAQFDVRTGEVLEPPADEPLPTYEVKVEGDAVWVGGPAS